MKATELIEKLQKIIAENGDVEIYRIDEFTSDELITSVDKVIDYDNTSHWVIQ